MKCEQVVLYANDELSPSEKAQFEAHLKGCVSCRQELALLRRMDETLSLQAAPQAVVDRLFSQTTRISHWYTGWKMWLAGALACSIFAMVLVPSVQQARMRQGVLAYLQENIETDYQNFENDLALFEQEF